LLVTSCISAANENTCYQLAHNYRAISEQVHITVSIHCTSNNQTPTMFSNCSYKAGLIQIILVTQPLNFRSPLTLTTSEDADKTGNQAELVNRC